MIDRSVWDDLARRALAEDLGPEGKDLTSLYTVDGTQGARGRFVFREPGVLCGTAWLESVFGMLDAGIHVGISARDGDWILPKECIAEIDGPARAILAGERTALNLLSRLSGIATITRAFARKVEGTRARIYDTRKTTPALRALEKYAVVCGGGMNHRMGLYDQILIKDNHIASSGKSPADLVSMARKRFSGKIIVEVDRPEDALPAAMAGADVVLLDNMAPESVKKVVEEIRAWGERSGARPTELEVSGGVTLENVRAYAEAGADRISVGALTHSARAVDIGLDFEPC